MDDLVKQLTPVAHLLWPFVLVALVHLDRRTRRMEKQQALNSQMLEFLVRNHKLEDNGSSHAIRL